MDNPGPNTITPFGRTPRPSGSGFSLIELVLVITIISILAAIAVPRYASALSRYRADAAARRIIADLEYARKHARNTSTATTVHVLTDTDSLKILGVSDLDHPGSGYQTRLSLGPYFADVTGVNFNNDYAVVFDGYGYPDSEGVIVIQVGTETRTVRLSADSGRAGVK